MAINDHPTIDTTNETRLGYNFAQYLYNEHEIIINNKNKFWNKFTFNMPQLSTSILWKTFF